MGVKVKELRPGKWFVVVRYKNKKWTQLIGSKTEAEVSARKIAQELKDQGMSPVLDRLSIRAPETTTVKEYAERWGAGLEKTDLKLSTINSYRSNLKHHIIPAFGGYELREISYSVLKQFIIEKVSQSYSKDTVRLMIVTMQLLMDEAFREGLIETPPVYKLGKFFRGAKRLREDPDPFSLKELHLVEDACERRWPEYYEFMVSMARTGIRIGEAIALQIADVDFVNQEIRIERNMPIHRQVTTPKTVSSKRVVEIGPELGRVLKAMLSRRKEEQFAKGKPESKWLFCNSEGNPLDYSNFAKAWNRMQNLAEVRRRRPHDLRHTFATLNLIAGKPLAWVSQQLGHKSPQITLTVYYRWVKGTKVGVSDVLDRKRPIEIPREMPVEKSDESGKKRQQNGNKQDLEDKNE
jgi:integrase